LLFCKSGKKQIRIGIDTPKNLKIQREEVWSFIREEQQLTRKINGNK
jgi:sRNA-binding carbon storage regulator CsrA